METTKNIILYLVTLFSFVGIDAIWLTLNSNYYKQEIGHLMAKNVNFVAIVIFYIIYTLGIIILVTKPAIEYGYFTKALVLGLILGLVAYGTYEFTNWATLKNWPLKMVIIDTIWGMSLTSIVSIISYIVGSKIL